MYLFIKGMVFPNPLNSSVVSILFPHAQIITIYKITMFVKEEIVVGVSEPNLLQFFQKLQSKGQNVN